MMRRATTTAAPALQINATESYGAAHLAAVVPGALWGSAYTLQGSLKHTAPGQESIESSTASGCWSECWKRWNRIAKELKLRSGAADQEAALLQAVTRDIKMATSKGQTGPLLLGHRKRRWARR